MLAALSIEWSLLKEQGSESQGKLGMYLGLVSSLLSFSDHKTQVDEMASGPLSHSLLPDDSHGSSEFYAQRRSLLSFRLNN